MEDIGDVVPVTGEICVFSFDFLHPDHRLHVVLKGHEPFGNHAFDHLHLVLVKILRLRVSRVFVVGVSIQLILRDALVNLRDEEIVAF